MTTTLTPKRQFLADNLREGEHYAGIILDHEDRDYHLILLPDEAENITWQEAKEWAARIGGELPNRREQPLLYANLKEQFKPNWYWSCEQHATDSDYAWRQGFYSGSQSYGDTGLELRARAVRRIYIGESK